MGATKNLALRLVVSEAAFLTGISSLIGLTSTLILLLSFARLIQLRLHIPYLMPPTANVIAIALGLWFMAVVAGALSSLLPALSSSRMDVYEAIRQGE
jgi:ABC-type antimicrobial peptide transport system permease subunit